MKFKKLFVAIASLAIACTASLSLVGCKKSSANYSETYEGTVSEQSYTSEETALTAFLGDEINSTETSVTYKSSEKQSTLTDEEVEKLNLGNVDKTKVERVDTYKVAYTKKTSTPAPYAAETEEKLNYVTVYVIVIETTPAGSSTKTYEYRYYVPLPKEGEALSSSYYESVFDSDKYKNCTVTYTMGTAVSAQGMTMNMNATLTMQLTENELAITSTATTNIPGGESANVSYYFKKNGNDIVGAVNTGTGYEKTSLEVQFDVSSFEEIYSLNMENAVYSFFEKTSYGFKMNEEMLEDLLADALDAALEQYAGATVDRNSCSAKYEFYIVEGRLDHADYNVSVALSYQGVSMVTRVNQSFRYSNYGNTTVTIPQEALDVMGN